MFAMMNNVFSVLKSIVVAPSSSPETFDLFCDLPDDVIRHIFQFTDFGVIAMNHTRKELSEKLSVSRPVSSGLHSTSKRFRQILSVNHTWLDFTALLQNTLSTYDKHQIEYDWAMDKRPGTDTNPLLLDLLFSGCDLPLAYHTKDTYTEEVDQIVRALVRMCPSLLECTFGILRCRDRVTPLHAAFINGKVPLSTVKYIIECMSVSCPHMLSHHIRVNGVEKDILRDIAEGHNMDPLRLQALTLLFEKHSS